MERKPQLSSREKQILFFYALAVIGVIGLYLIFNWLRLGVSIVQPGLHKAEIAILVPLQGEEATNGRNVVDGVTNAKNFLINELGLSEWEITIRSYDSGRTANTAAWAAYQAAKNPNTVAIIGPLDARQVLAVSKTVEGDNIAIITPASTTPSLRVSTFEGLYRIPSTDDLQGPALVDLLIRKNYVDIYLLVESNEYAKYVLESMMAESAGRIQLVGSVDINQKDPALDLVQNMRDSNPDAIVYLGGSDNLVLLLQELNNKNVNIPIVATDNINNSQIANFLSGEQELFFTSPIYSSNKNSGTYYDLLGSDTIKPLSAESAQAVWLILEALASNSDGLGRKTVWENLPYVSIRINGKALDFSNGQLSPSNIYIYKGGSSINEWFVQPEYIFNSR
jgi:branched-chain amino acid transport system substrate-binding protein